MGEPFEFYSINDQNCSYQKGFISIAKANHLLNARGTYMTSNAGFPAEEYLEIGRRPVEPEKPECDHDFVVAKYSPHVDNDMNLMITIRPKFCAQCGKEME